MGERFQKLVRGQIIDSRFTSQSLKRIQFYDDIEFNEDRLLIYEIIQEQHKHLESIQILLDARFIISSVLDFLISHALALRFTVQEKNITTIYRNI